MLVARAFVLGLNARAALAVVIVASSVAYALLTGVAVQGLQDASGTLGSDLVNPKSAVARPGLAPFPLSEAPEGSVVLTHAAWRGGSLGTVRPWPHADQVVPGPYASSSLPLAELGPPVTSPQFTEGAPGDWVLVPPATFDRLFPELAGRATIALAASGGVPAPAAGAFYREGAGQVFASVQLVIAAVGVLVAIFAGGVLRLEVLARERDLATLEALGGAGTARRAVVLRTAFIVGLGVALGVAAGLGASRVATRALNVPFRLDLVLVAETALVALVAGLVAGALGSLVHLRAPVASRLGRRGPSARPFPGPVRFLLVTPRLALSAFSAAFILVAVTSVVLAAAATPFTIFHPGGGVEVIGQSGGNPFRGSADRFLGEHLTLFPGINASSPETIAPGLVEGHPAVVRGVVFEPWLRLGEARLAEGRWPSAPGEASAGARLARLAGLDVGDQALVPGAYRATVRLLTVVGIHEGAGLGDDELLTDLDTAGDLAGLPPSLVHMVRVEGSEDAVATALAAPPLQVTRLGVTPVRPVPGTEASAVVELLNLAGAESTRALTLRVNGVVVGSAVARVAPHGTASLAMPFLVPQTPSLAVEVNPTANVTTGAPTLRVQAPETVAPNTTFTVRVLDPSGAPVADARVLAGRVERRTDAQGAVGFFATREGRLAIEARSGSEVGATVVYIVDPAFALGPRLIAERAVAVGAAAIDDARARYDFLVTLANIGGARFEGELNATANGTAVGRALADVGSRQLATIALSVEVPRGTPAIEVAGLTVPLAPQAGPQAAPVEQRPRTIEDVLAEKRLALQRSQEAKELSGRAFLEDVFASLEPSVVVVVLATFAQAAAGVAVAVVREVREREEVLRVLRDLGATREQVAARSARDAVVAALPPIALGAAAALLALALAQPSGFPAAFGHTILISPDAGFYLRVVGALALVAAATAVFAARAPTEPALRQAPPVPLRRLLEAP